MTLPKPYQEHLQSADDLITTYEARRAGFVALALEKNRRATPYVEEARVLQALASKAARPAELLHIKGIEAGLLAAAGLSDKALNHLRTEDKQEAVSILIERFLEPAGDNFVEELVYRFLLTRGDTLGGSMRNAGGVLAQRKLTRAIISVLSLSGLTYHWLHSQTKQWHPMVSDSADTETFVRGLTWSNVYGGRTLIYNFTVPLVQNNVDMCLLDNPSLEPAQLNYTNPDIYLAFGELKGGIDPAGADEHWKTAHTALERIRDAFQTLTLQPRTFFIGAAIERKMAREIWSQLEVGLLANAANLNEPAQVAALAHWLCQL